MLPNPVVTGEGQQMLRETNDTNIYGFATWCLDYHNRTPYPSNSTLQRFVIGHYQLSQGIKWNSTKEAINDFGERYSEYESFAAAACHFAMTAGALGLHIADDIVDPLNEDYPIIDLRELTTKSLDYKELTVKMSECAQMVFYNSITNGASRKGRYNPVKTQRLLAELVVILFSSIPQSKRSEALEQATSILTKRL